MGAARWFWRGFWSVRVQALRFWRSFWFSGADLLWLWSKLAGRAAGGDSNFKTAPQPITAPDWLQAPLVPRSAFRQPVSSSVVWLRSSRR
jgi:hypothetical protein